MDVMSMLFEIREAGYYWGLFLNPKKDEASFVAYRGKKSNDDYVKFKSTGPVTAIPNLIFMTLREIRKRKKDERKKLAGLS